MSKYLDELDNYKYVIEAGFNINKKFTKSEILSIILTETEGLIDKNLNDLIKERKVGEIYVEIDKSGVSGIIKIPTNLTQVETSLIAASLETINQININVKSIVDLREEKKNYISERARKFLDSFKSTNKEDLLNKFERANSFQKFRHTKRYSNLIGNLDKDEVIIVKKKEDFRNLVSKGFDNVIELGPKIYVPFKIYLKLRSKILIVLVNFNDRKYLNKLRKILDIDYFSFSKKDVLLLSRKEIKQLIEEKTINIYKKKALHSFIYFLGLKRKYNKKIIKIIEENILKDNFLLISPDYKIIQEERISDFQYTLLNKRTAYIIYTGRLDKNFFKALKKNKLVPKEIYCKNYEFYPKDYNIITFDEIFDN